MYREKEVRAGMAYLDKQVPHWRSKFDPASLDIGSVDDCVLCQIFDNEYNQIVCYELALSEEQADALGFYILRDDLFSSWSKRESQFASLTATWKALFDEKPATLPILERIPA